MPPHPKCSRTAAPGARRGTRGRVASAALVVALLAVSGTTHASGQDGEAAAAPPPPVDPLAPMPLSILPVFGEDDDPLSPALGRVSAGSTALSEALAAHDATAAQLTATVDVLNASNARLARLLAKEAQVVAHARAARSRERAARFEQRRHESALGELAVDAFTAGSDRALDLIDPAAAQEAQRRRGLTRAVTSHEAALLELTRAQVADARAEVALAGDRIARLRAEQRLTAARRDAARDQAFTLALTLSEQRIAAQQARAEATVLRLDMKMVALDAYVLAAHRMNAERPACRLSWAVLAGIGRVESRHGTYRGAGLLWDGTTDPHIIGVALTGAGGVAYVGDSDGGALDGDAAHDRAVGPMQFIPTSWRLFGRDGNADETEDPHNIYDAALAAAEHLCRRYSALDTPEGLRAALLSYNRSIPYGERVMSLAAQYAAAGLPIGRTFRPLDPEDEG